MLSFKVPRAANCIIGIYCVFLDVRFPKIPGCDFRRISELPGNLPIFSPGLSAFLNFSGPRRKKGKADQFWEWLWVEKLVSCVVLGLIPKLRHLGKRRQGRQEWFLKARSELCALVEMPAVAQQGVVRPHRALMRVGARESLVS